MWEVFIGVLPFFFFGGTMYGIYKLYKAFQTGNKE